MRSLKKANNGYENRFYYLITGLFCTGVGLFINVPALVSGKFSNAIMVLALGISQLMMFYFARHLFPRDERTDKIIGKAMAANYFVLFALILVLFISTSSFGPFTLSGE